MSHLYSGTLPTLQHTIIRPARGNVNIVCNRGYPYIAMSKLKSWLKTLETWEMMIWEKQKPETDRDQGEREIMGAICRQSVSTVTSSVLPWETFYRPQKRCEHYDWWYCQTLWSGFYIRVDIWQSRKMQMPHCLPFIALSSTVNHEGKKRLYFCDFARIFVI